MPEPFELLMEAEVFEQFKRLRGEARRNVRAFVASLPANPYLRAYRQYEDAKGRIIEVALVATYEIHFHADHAIREVKVMRLERLG